MCEPRPSSPPGRSATQWRSPQHPRPGAPSPPWARTTRSGGTSRAFLQAAGSWAHRSAPLARSFAASLRAGHYPGARDRYGIPWRRRRVGRARKCTRGRGSRRPPAVARGRDRDGSGIRSPPEQANTSPWRSTIRFPYPYRHGGPLPDRREGRPQLVSRRRLLRLAGGAGLVATVGACSERAASPPVTSSPAVTSGPEAGPAATPPPFSDIDAVFAPAWKQPAVASPAGSPFGIWPISTPAGPGFEFIVTDQAVTTWNTKTKAILAVKTLTSPIGKAENWTFNLYLPKQSLIQDWHAGVLWEFHTNSSSGHHLALAPDGTFRIGRQSAYGRKLQLHQWRPCAVGSLGSGRVRRQMVPRWRRLSASIHRREAISQLFWADGLRKRRRPCICSSVFIRDSEPA